MSVVDSKYCISLASMTVWGKQFKEGCESVAKFTIRSGITMRLTTCCLQFWLGTNRGAITTSLKRWQSLQWKHFISAPAKESKGCNFHWKGALDLFLDHQGSLLNEFAKPGENINCFWYCENLDLAVCRNQEHMPWKIGSSCYRKTPVCMSLVWLKKNWKGFSLTSQLRGKLCSTQPQPLAKWFSHFLDNRKTSSREPDSCQMMTWRSQLQIFWSGSPRCLWEGNHMTH